MGRLRVQNKMKRSTSEEFGSGNMYMLLDEIDIVHIDWNTTKSNKKVTLPREVLQFSIALGYSIRMISKDELTSLITDSRYPNSVMSVGLCSVRSS